MSTWRCFLVYPISPVVVWPIAAFSFFDLFLLMKKKWQEMKPRLLVSLIPSIHVYQASFAVILMHSSFHQWNKHLAAATLPMTCSPISATLCVHRHVQSHEMRGVLLPDHAANDPVQAEHGRGPLQSLGASVDLQGSLALLPLPVPSRPQGFLLHHWLAQKKECYPHRRSALEDRAIQKRYLSMFGPLRGESVKKLDNPAGLPCMIGVSFTRFLPFWWKIISLELCFVKDIHSKNQTINIFYIGPLPVVVFS